MRIISGNRAVQKGVHRNENSHDMDDTICHLAGIMRLWTDRNHTAIYELSVTFPRLAGEDLLVVGPPINPSLRFTPGELPSHVLSISRGGVTCAVLSACNGGPDECISLLQR